MEGTLEILMEEFVIQTNKLTKCFGKLTAVDSVTFEVKPAEIIGYLGPNGSGKTTTIRMLCGVILPSAGSARVLGLDIVRYAERIKPQVGYMSQKTALYEELTVRENLEFYALVYGVRSNKRVRDVIESTGLTEYSQVRAGHLSGGWRQRLALGCALVHEPRLLYLDEPTSGLDPVARREFWDRIYALASQGTTIFVSTHYMDEAEHCSRVGFMHSGKLLAMDTPKALKASHLCGVAWDIETDRLVDGLMAVRQLAAVREARIAGDHLHVIASPGEWDAESLGQALAARNLAGTRVMPAEVTLEDMFVSLTRR
jgi:ABC-2 type transport system ATP-binding protein